MKLFPAVSIHAMTMICLKGKRPVSVGEVQTVESAESLPRTRGPHIWRTWDVLAVKPRGERDVLELCHARRPSWLICHSRRELFIVLGWSLNHPVTASTRPHAQYAAALHGPVMPLGEKPYLAKWQNIYIIDHLLQSKFYAQNWIF